MDFLLADVVAVTQALTPARVRTLLPGAGKQITSGEALFLWLADSLATLTQLPADQQDLLLTEFKPRLEDVGRRLWRTLLTYETGQPATDVLAAHLVVWDRRLASLSGKEGFLNLQKAEWEAELKQAPLLSEALDLTTLFTRNRARMTMRAARREGGKDARRIPDDG